MPPQTLRDYQSRGVRAVFDAWREGARSVLAVSPTGSGKTTLFSWIASRAPSEVLILVHRRELAAQATNRLREFGVDFGFILSGERPKPYARVQVASVQTLVRRKTPPARFVIVDEAHLSTAETWAKVLAFYPKALVLGVTATPWRLSGKPLVGAYDRCVVIATPRELREQGHLCDYAGFSYLAPDLDQIETVGGEYDKKQSAEAMRQPSIVANVVEQWQAHASDLSTVVFAVTVEHSKALAGEFRAIGVQAEHLDGTTPLQQRAAILRRVDSGLTRVLCNVGVAIEGLDIPRLKCCVLARPTKSLARAIQMMGRVRRPWNGVRARIHDHAFLIKQHGLPDADREYTLSAKKERAALDLTNCPKCRAWFSGRSCPECRHVSEPTARGELVTVDDAERFEFDSAAAEAVAALEGVKLTADDLQPVDVRWDTPGRAVEGRYTGAVVEQANFGPMKVYTLTGAKRRYRLPGTAHLNVGMSQLRGGETVRVTYLGTLGAGRKKLFTVEVDDGA